MAEYKIKIVVEGEDRASGPLRGVTGALGQMGTIAGGIGLASVLGGVTHGAQQAGAAMVGMVTDAGDLESQIDAIGAVSGASAGEMVQLAGLIGDLGINPNLKVSTNEAADAIEMLVRNGLTLDEVFAGAAEQTVLLANSTGAEFATSADIATDAMAIFGIGADEMASAVNGITGVVAESKFDINDYQMALAQGGAAAAVAGVSFDEFNTAVAGISSNFASGSDAGTSLKTMLQRLAPQSKEAAAAMGELGLEFFNADGSMKGMAEVAGELNAALFGQVEFSSLVGGRTAEQNDELKRLQGRYTSISASISDYESGVNGAGLSEEARAKKVGELRAQLAAVEGQMGPLAAVQGELVSTTRALTEEERLNYLTTIFGADAMRAAAAMAGMTTEQFAALQQEIGQSDAMVQAAQRMDNLAGDAEIFGGVLEAVGLQVGDAFQEPAREAVQGLTALLSAATPTLVSWAGDAAEAVSGAVEALSSPEAQAAAADAWTAIESVFTGQALTVTVDYKVEAPPEGLEPPPMQPLRMSDLISGEKVAIPLVPIWEGETPDETVRKMVNTEWRVKIFGLWEVEVPDWLKAGALTVAVNLAAHGADGLGQAAAEGVSSGMQQVDWGQAAGGFGEWFRAQNFYVPITLPGGKTGSVEISGEGLMRAAEKLQTALGQGGEKMASSLAGALTSMNAGWDGMVAGLTTAGDNIGYSLDAAWTNVKAGWDGAMAGLSAWTWPVWEWPTLPAWEWPVLPAFSWPAMPSFSWPSFPAFRWPSFPSFSWPGIPRPTWSWPSIPMPGWLGQLGALLGGGGSGGGSGRAVGGRAGGLTWVGEFGPELVNLPQGSMVFSAGQSRRLAGEVGGGQVINVAATINTPLDVEELTRTIADRVRRRGF
jgi:TP901 family phage tail tape measure protein